MGEIREDQKAKLSFKLADDSEYELECFIKDIHADRLSLTFPKELISYAKHLEEGDEVPVKIYTPAGIRMYNAMILDSPVDSEFVIEYVEDNIQVQRREFIRGTLETKIIIERRISENIVTHTIDIGGGGIRFFYEGEFYPNEDVSCRLYLPFQMSSIKTQGNIINSPHLPPNEHVILFHKITNSDRSKIIQKCFELQTAAYKRYDS